MIRVGVVDDHPVSRFGLVQAIGSAADLEVVAVARSVDEFDSFESGPGVVIMDACLPGVGGSAAVALMSARGHAVLVLAESEARTDVVAALSAGACGYLSKRVELAEVLDAVRAVAQGRTYVSASFNVGPLRAHVTITARELEILQLVAGGRTDRDIALTLGICVSTIHSHLDRIRDKTGLRRRAELTRLVLERGGVDLPLLK